MKTSIVIFTLFISIGLCSANAQTAVNKRSNLKGPKAKNQKAWDKPADQTSSIVILPSGDLKGPKAKNTSLADRETSDALVESSKANKVTGPKYKNRRPGAPY